MAIDAWLLQQHRQGKHPPALRFYKWQPVAISLGYHQRRYPSEWHSLSWAGQKLDLVRRPTGGRAVLHQGDLTYSLITSGVKGKAIEVYEHICQFLIQGWQSLGMNIDYGVAGRDYIHQANCFALATGADLVDNQGRKFIGSAQLRRGDAVLQHGAMLLEQDSSLFEKVFHQPAPERPLVPSGLSLERMMEALVKAAGECFGADFIVRPLSPEEWQSVRSGKNYE